jgi:hypothetical protein
VQAIFVALQQILVDGGLPEAPKPEVEGAAMGGGHNRCRR